MLANASPHDIIGLKYLHGSSNGIFNLTESYMGLVRVLFVFGLDVESKKRK